MWKIHQGQTGVWVASNGSMFKKNSKKLVAAKGRGKSINTRYSKSKSRKEAVGVYVYELKKRK